MEITVRFVNPETNDGHIEIYSGTEFGEVEAHEFYDENTTGILHSDPEGIELKHLADIQQAVEDIGDESAVHAWIEDKGGFLDRVDPVELYRGHYASLEVFAQEFAEDVEGVPGRMMPYINWEAFAHDLSYDLDVLDAPDGGVYLFWPA